MLPLSLLQAATNSPLLVELKGGDTYNGRLVSCDPWMNMNLRDVICTSKDGDRFWKLEGCYIRGSSVKYLRLLPEILEKAAEESKQQSQRQFQPRTGGRGRGSGNYNNTEGEGRGRGNGRGRGGSEGRGRGEGRGDGRGRGRGSGRGRGRAESGERSSSGGRGRGRSNNA